MNADFARRVAGVGSLVEPVRRRLYAFVVGQDDAVSRDQAAAGLDIARHTAKFHLDRLVDDGLLETEFRRLTGREGPGAGRPAKLYRRSSVPVSVSLPERRYDLAGQVLAEAVESASRDGVPVDDAVRRIAGETGRRLARDPESAPGPDDAPGLDMVAAALGATGFEPHVEADGRLVLGNCPFHALAQQHTDLVCGMNLALIEGVVDGLECSDLQPALDPALGRCCVTVTARGQQPGR